MFPIFAAIALASQVSNAPTATQNHTRYQIGFYRGNDFYVAGNRHHLEGINLGADVPVSRAAGPYGTVTISPSVMLGGVTRKGADTDGNIFRLALTDRKQLTRSGLYLGTGFGYGNTQARGSQFANKRGLLSEISIGLTPQTGRAAAIGIQPSVELKFHNGPDNRLRGWALQASAKF